MNGVSGGNITYLFLLFFIVLFYAVKYNYNNVYLRS